jgi:hypothetical protein
VTLPAQSLPDDATEPDMDADPDPSERDAPFTLTFLAVVGISALVVIFCVLGAAVYGLFNTGGAGEEVPASVGTTAAALAPATSMPDGQWLVGQDIQPGSYSVAVAVGSPGCTWERNSSTDGSATSVLESGAGNEGQTLVVGIRDTDVVFQSRGCGTWQRTGDWIQPSQ